MKKVLVSSLSIVLLFSCSIQKGYIKFNDSNEDEIISSSAIKDYMKSTKNPSIVLKAPDAKDRATESEDNSYIFNAIEKELLLAGFDVKDRGLFNEVVSKSQEVDYSEIKRITGTDLILELVQYDPTREYKTNKFYTKDDKELVEPGTVFTAYGAIVEFKITIIEGNKHGGSYLFYYTPCATKNEGCICEVAYKPMPQTVYKRHSFCNDSTEDSRAFESIPRDQLSEFVRNGVKRMLAEIE